MDAQATIDRALSAGVTLTVNDGRLTYDGPADAVADLLPDLRAHRDEIAALLDRGPPWTTDHEWLTLPSGAIVRADVAGDDFSWNAERGPGLIGTEYPARPSPPPPDAICESPRAICSRCRSTPVLPAVPGCSAALCFDCWRETR